MSAYEHVCLLMSMYVCLCACMCGGGGGVYANVCVHDGTHCVSLFSC